MQPLWLTHTWMRVRNLTLFSLLPSFFLSFLPSFFLYFFTFFFIDLPNIFFYNVFLYSPSFNFLYVEIKYTYTYLI